MKNGALLGVKVVVWFDLYSYSVASVYEVFCSYIPLLVVEGHDIGRMIQMHFALKFQYSYNIVEMNISEHRTLSYSTEHEKDPLKHVMETVVSYKDIFRQ